MTGEPFTDDDRGHMARALELARRGLFTTTPNPRVGCVIVREGVVLGEGWHAVAGGPHAEAAAIAAARARGQDLRGSTLYVTLEPCNHTGRTPPCADAIVEAGIASVVCAMADPNPAASGGGERLRAAGVTVRFGLLEDEARDLNIGFVSRVTRGRPWVRTKIAATLDGRTALANGRSQWITGEAARADGHAWRARACAIMTGIGTVRADDPRLTVRAVETPRQPLKVIVDRRAETPHDARALADGDVLIVTAGPRNTRWPANVSHLALRDVEGNVDLPSVMEELGERGINELHVEAGQGVNGRLLAAGLVDELIVYVAPSLICEPGRGMFERFPALDRLEDRVRLSFHAFDRIGDDLFVRARVVRKEA